MKLKEYLAMNNISATKFADKCGYNPTYIRSIVSGKPAGSKLARIINNITDGQVSIDELMPPIQLNVCPHCHRVLPKHIKPETDS
jgi:DNA-binding transcriptional regulator YdaS (Cro superfamily)